MIKTISNTSTLANRLRERINREGPMTFCEWMKAALYDSADGYYCRADRSRWGREGDYRTSPERTSLFSATFARYFADLYEQLDRPTTWTILEAGAGAGDFAGGVLQTLREAFPEIYSATLYVIDEISPSSRAHCLERLRPFSDRVQFRRLDEVEIDSGVVFSNELLDAFPVHRITLRDGQLQEFYVTTGDEAKFEWLLGKPSLKLAQRVAGYFEQAGSKPVEGQVLEVSLKIEEWLRRIAAGVRNGFVVTVDYGSTGDNLDSPQIAKEGTLRGFQRHRFVEDLLACPGEQDLTTNVNWEFVKTAGARERLEFVALNRLDRFLLANGFLEQLEVESLKAKDEVERLQLSSAAREMILPDGMAAHFQVLVQKKTRQQ